MDDQAQIIAALAPYRAEISATPFLLSLLYDIDLLPEQIGTKRSAALMIAICEAYRAGKKAGAGNAAN